MSSQPEKPSTPPDAHAHWRRLLERHLDGDIAPGERMDLFDHLEECDECRAILEAEERLITRLRELPRLVPPADLRAGILDRVAREREEAGRMVTAEAPFRDLLEKPEPVLEWRADPDDDPSAAARPPAPRPRTRWQRWSPVLATAFLGVAALTAFFGGDLSAVPTLSRLQALAIAGVRQVASIAAPQLPGVRGPDNVSGSGMADIPPAETRTFRPELRVPAAADLGAPRLPLVEAAVDAWRASRGALARMAAAAEVPLPGPAERGGAVVAIVIRATDAAESVTLADDVGAALRTTAEARGGVGLQHEDQFVSEGRRYRCYTVRAAPPWVEQLVRNLDPYRSPEDAPALRALSEQGHTVRERQHVAFFAAPRRALHHAVSRVEADPESDNTPASEIRVFVVE